MAINEIENTDKLPRARSGAELLNEFYINKVLIDQVLQECRQFIPTEKGGFQSVHLILKYKDNFSEKTVQRAMHAYKRALKIVLKRYEAYLQDPSEILARMQKEEH